MGTDSYSPGRFVDKADFTLSPILSSVSEKNLLLGDQSKVLLAAFPEKAILRLIFSSALAVLLDRSVEASQTQSMSRSLVEFASDCRHELSSFLKLDAASDREFLTQLQDRTAIFGGRCELTRDLGWEVAARFDAFLDKPEWVEMFTEIQKEMVYELVLLDGQLNSAEKSLIEQLITDGNKYKKISAQLRLQVKGADDPYVDVKSLDIPQVGRTLHKGMDREEAEVVALTHNIEGDEHSALQEARHELAQLEGLEEVKEEIEKIDAFLKIKKHRELAGLPVPNQTLHFAFYGNPGTGKTTVARILGKFFFGYGLLEKGHVVETDRVGLVGGYVGHTAIKTDERIQEAMDGILFVDEAYSLSSGEGTNDFGREAVETILKRMEDHRERLVVVVAGYPELMSKFMESNPGLKSRFTRHLHFSDYGPVSLGRILRRMVEDGGYVIEGPMKGVLSVLLHAEFEERSEDFGNARFVRNIYEEMIAQQAVRLASHTGSGEISNDDLRLLKREDLPTDAFRAAKKDLDLSQVTWQYTCPACGATRSLALADLEGMDLCPSCQNVDPHAWPSSAHEGVEADSNFGFNLH